MYGYGCAVYRALGGGVGNGKGGKGWRVGVVGNADYAGACGQLRGNAAQRQVNGGFHYAFYGVYGGQYAAVVHAVFYGDCFYK